MVSKCDLYFHIDLASCDCLGFDFDLLVVLRDWVDSLPFGLV